MLHARKDFLKIVLSAPLALLSSVLYLQLVKEGIKKLTLFWICFEILVLPAEDTHLKFHKIMALSR